jgi:hypothetical protein
MLSPTRLLIIGLLTFPAGSCAAVSNYLAGMDDNPGNYTWEPVEQAARAQAAATREITRQERQQPVEGVHPRSTPFEEMPQQAPVPVVETPQQTSVPVAETAHKDWRRDLEDCEAPGPQAGGAEVAQAGTPTIARSEDSPLVAACMVAKGYQKVYQARTGIF